MAKDLKTQIQKSQRALDMAESLIGTTVQQLPALEQEVQDVLTPAAEAMNGLLGSVAEAKKMIELAQRKYQSVDQLKAKSKEKQQFWQDLVDEIVEIEAELKKKKGDKTLTKQRELKLKAVAKAEAVSKAANGDVDEAIRAIESVTENFSDEFLKPILGAAMQLEKWQTLLRKHFHSVTDIDLAAGKEMKQRVAACERYLK